VRRKRGEPAGFQLQRIEDGGLYHVREHPKYAGEIQTREAALQRGERMFEQLLPLYSPQTLAPVREFRHAVVRDLVDRTMLAAKSWQWRA
jgi:hypothetical protein